MLRRVLLLEEEAEKGRAELAAQLEKAAQGDRRARAAAENALSIETLRLQLSSHEVIVSLLVSVFSGPLVLAVLENTNMIHVA